MGDIRRDPLSTLRPGGYVNDISLGAMMRPPLSMPDGAGQTEERTLLGGAYQSPLHSPQLPAGMTYNSDDYGMWRESLLHQRALQQGISPEILPGREDDSVMKRLNRLSWARGEGGGDGRRADRGVQANQEMQNSQLFFERELWNKNLKERFGRR